MNALFARLNNYVKALSGLKLLYLVISCIIASLVLGLAIGYVFVLVRDPVVSDQPVTARIPVTEKHFTGRVDYVDPRLYSNKGVSYVLVDSKGKVLFLLKAQGETLRFAEGHEVKAYGNVEKKAGNDKYDTLVVTKVAIKGSKE
jgi:hypothetical protein